MKDDGFGGGCGEGCGDRLGPLLVAGHEEHIALDQRLGELGGHKAERCRLVVDAHEGSRLFQKIPLRGLG